MADRGGRGGIAPGAKPARGRGRGKGRYGAPQQREDPGGRRNDQRPVRARGQAGPHNQAARPRRAQIEPIAAQPAGAAQGLAAALVPPRRLTLREVGKLFVSSFKPKVTAAMLEEAKVCFPGTQFIMENNGAAQQNPHELLAIARTIATVQMLGAVCQLHQTDDAHAINEPISIDFLWGAHRDHIYLERLNKLLTDNGYPEAVAYDVGEQYLSADFFRRPVVAHVKTGEYALVTNVYETGYNHQEMTPQFLGALGYRHVFWAGHRFGGLYGALSTAVWCLVDGLVHWTADETAAIYPAHRPCELMHTQGADAAYQWTIYSTVAMRYKDGPQFQAVYDILHVCRRVCTDREVRAFRPLPVTSIELEIPDSNAIERYFTSTPSRDENFFSRLRRNCWSGLGSVLSTCVNMSTTLSASVLPNRVVHLMVDDHAHAIRVMETKGYSQYSFRALQAEVSRYLSAKPAFAAAERAFPGLFVDYRSNLVIAAFTHNIREKAAHAQAIRVAHADSFQAINLSVSNIDSPETSRSSKKPLILIFLGLILIFHAYVPRGLKVRLWRLLSWCIRPANAMDNLVTSTQRAARLLIEYAVDWPRRYFEVAEFPGAGELMSSSAEYLQRLTKGPAAEVINTTFHEAVKDTSTNQHASKILRTIGLVFPALVTAPFFEEAFKMLAEQHGQSMRFAAVTVLAAGDIMAQFHPLSFLWHWSLHHTMAHGPYKWRVLKHASWNMLALLIEFALHGTLWKRKAKTAHFWLAPFLCLIYWLYTRVQTRIRAIPPVAKFDAHWYPLEPIEQPVHLSELEDDVTLIPDANAMVRPYTAIVPDLSPDEIDQEITITAQHMPYSGPTDNSSAGYYRIYGHNFPMFRPANTGQNMWAVVQHRLAIALPFESQPRLWWSAAAIFSGAMSAKSVDTWPKPPTEFDESWDSGKGWPTLAAIPQTPENLMLHGDRELITAWLQHVEPKKRSVYTRALNQVSTNPLTLKCRKLLNVQVNIKKDEVLLKVRLTKSDKPCIPRPIHNVDPTVAVTLGPHIYAASDNIKRWWRWDNMTLSRMISGDEPLTLTYGAGLSASELDDWFAFSLSHHGWHVLVAGDDSVVVHFTEQHVQFYEADISKCDRSVTQPALCFEYLLLESAHVPQEVLALLYASSSATCIASLNKADHGSVRINRPASRNTGGVDTTVGNTTVVAGAWVYAIRFLSASRPTDTAISDVFAMMGFSLKIKSWGGPLSAFGSAFFGPSFLKGYWYPCLQSSGSLVWAWGPLISRMLKMSKIMTNPIKVYRMPCEPKPSYEIACRRHLAACYHTYVLHSWPKELIHWLRERADPAWLSATPIEEWANPVRPQGRLSVPQVQRSWLNQAAWWYNVDQEVIESWLRNLAQLDVNQYSRHPFWALMALRDYG